MSKQLELKKAHFILKKHGFKETKDEKTWFECGSNQISAIMLANMIYTLKEFKDN